MASPCRCAQPASHQELDLQSVRQWSAHHNSEVKIIFLPKNNLWLPEFKIFLFLMGHILSHFLDFQGTDLLNTMVQERQCMVLSGDQRVGKLSIVSHRRLHQALVNHRFHCEQQLISQNVICKEIQI